MQPTDEQEIRSRSDAPAHTRITARQPWFDFGLSEMWDFRAMIRILAVRDVKLRYRQTILGVAGVIIAPLLTAGVFSFVFGQVARLPSEGVPYVAFSFAGFLAWNTFSSVLGRASGALLHDSSLVSRIYVPRLLLPLSGVLVAMVDLGISSLLMVVLMASFQLAPGLAILTAPVWIASIVAIALGVGIALGAFMVHYRDVGLATSAGLQIMLYLTPVAYSASAVPDKYRFLYLLNPLAAPVEGFRWSLLGTAAPSIARTAFSAAAGLVLLFVGAVIFTRLERGLADVI